MTPAIFKSYRIQLGLSQSGLAELLRSDTRTIRRWEAADREIPGPAEVAIEALADGWRPK